MSKLVLRRLAEIGPSCFAVASKVSVAVHRLRLNDDRLSGPCPTKNFQALQIKFVLFTYPKTWLALFCFPVSLFLAAGVSLPTKFHYNIIIFNSTKTVEQ